MRTLDIVFCFWAFFFSLCDFFPSIRIQRVGCGFTFVNDKKHTFSFHEKLNPERLWIASVWPSATSCRALFCFPGSHWPHTFVCVYGRKQKWNVRHFVCSTALKPVDSFTLFLLIDSFCIGILWIRAWIPSLEGTAPPICRGTFMRWSHRVSESYYWLFL